MLNIWSGVRKIRYPQLHDFYVVKAMEKNFNVNWNHGEGEVGFFYEGQGFEDINKTKIPAGFWSIDTDTYQIWKDLNKDITIFVASYNFLDVAKNLAKKDNIYFLPQGFDPESYFPIEEKELNYDIGFMGRFDGYPLREEHLNYLKSLGFKVKIELTDILHPLGIEKVREFYSDCKTIYNNSQFGINMRVFEALALKKPLLTNRIYKCPDILFKNNEHLFIFEYKKDLATQLDYIIGNEDERKRIAENGWREVQQYTWDNEVKKAIDILMMK